jgi:hypothetical protein
MNKFFIWYCFFARLNHPEMDSLDEYMEYLIPKIRYFGEDLSEEHFYRKQRWVQLIEGSSDVVLHMFEPVLEPEGFHGGTYYIVRNGNVKQSSWAYMEGNKMILHGNQLYDLGFLNPYVFILRKHGDNEPLNRGKFIVLVGESSTRGIMSQALGTGQVNKETLAELLYHYYAFNNFVTAFIIIGVPFFLLALYIFI